jgi:hypothetical protein
MKAMNTKQAQKTQTASAGTSQSVALCRANRSNLTAAANQTDT